MGRRSFSRGLSSSIGGKKGAAKRQMISSFSGVSINAPKINKASNRQRMIRNIKDTWW